MRILGKGRVTALLALGLGAPFSFGPPLLAAEKGRAVEIHVFDAPVAHSHAQEVLSVIHEGVKDCPTCQVIHHPIYTLEGELRSGLILEETNALFARLRKAKCRPETGIVLHFSLNLRSSEKTGPVEKRLREMAACGAYVVAAAGENPENRHRMLRLKDTIMGRAKGVLVIGEKKEGKLAPRSNYGPELFTSLEPPKGKRGSSFSAAVFSAKLARALAESAKPNLAKLK